MIPRLLEAQLGRRRSHYPVVTVTGPRQSGKTTLCRAVGADLPYASLEAPDVRAFALEDPRGFLAQFPRGAVLDEVQRAPEILSYLQEIVDERRATGEWILTGSQNFALLSGLSQSLAGRTAVLHLFPFEVAELRGRVPERDLFETLLTGGYPPIHDRRIPPNEFHADYTATYVERDVRQIVNVGDLTAFQTFLRVAAGRSAQLLNLTSLGSDVGVSFPTAKSWLSVLEACFLAFRVAPMHRHAAKRAVKTPKLHLLDSGLLCFLLGIREPEQLVRHPLRGAIFETFVASEVRKGLAHRGLAADLSFYRDRHGVEVDLILELGGRFVAIDAKSGQTFTSEFLKPLQTLIDRLDAAARERAEAVVVYGGEREERRAQGRVLPWSRVDALLVD